MRSSRSCGRAIAADDVSDAQQSSLVVYVWVSLSIRKLDWTPSQMNTGGSDCRPLLSCNAMTDGLACWGVGIMQ